MPRLVAWLLLALGLLGSPAGNRITPSLQPPRVIAVAGWLSGAGYFNIRAAPRITATVVATATWGQRLTIRGAVSGDVVNGVGVWYRVAGGNGGYIHASGISYVESPLPWVGLAGVQVGVAMQPRAAGQIEATFPPGTPLSVIGIVHGDALDPGNDVWYLVSTGSYRPVFVYSADLTYDRPGQAGVPVPLVTAAAVLAIDLDAGRTLYSRNADVERAPASLVKMMTAAVALDRVAPNTPLTVPAGAPSVGAAVGGTSMGLTPGQRLSLRDLLYGMLMPSGNDAAYTIAQDIAGSQAAFALLMNDRGAALGLAHTHFVQGYGLDDPDQYSTARDLARLARYDLMHYPLFARIVATSVREIGVGPTHSAYLLHSTNRLLGVYPGVFGVKTGTTPAAGQNLVEAVHRDGRRVLVVILGALDRYADARALLDYAVALDR